MKTPGLNLCDFRPVHQFHLTDYMLQEIGAHDWNDLSARCC
jgi:hypothetical protein